MSHIRKFRDAFGLSQYELALFLGISRNHINRHESSGTEVPESASADIKRLHVLYTQISSAEFPVENPDDPMNATTRERLTRIVDGNPVLIRRHEKTLREMEASHKTMKLHWEVLTRFMQEQTENESTRWKALVHLSSILKKKLRKCRPQEQFALKFRIKVLTHEKEIAESFLKTKSIE